MVFVTACSQPAFSGVMQAAGVYRYVSYSYGGEGFTEIKIDLIDGKIVYPHTFSELRLCDSRATGPCFTSAPLSFCMPETMDISRSWKCAGKRFEFIEDQKIQIFGEAIPVVVVRSEDVYFYFSDSRGLLAIKFTGDTALSEFYISMGRNGFGNKGNKWKETKVTEEIKSIP